MYARNFPSSRKLSLLLLMLSPVLFVTSCGLFPSNQPTATPQGAGASRYPANVEFDPPGVYAYGAYNPASLTNANVAGVVVNFPWGAVEPQQRVFNFAPADKEIAAWVAAGKKIMFQIRFLYQGGTPSVPNCGAANGPNDLPGWEVARIPHFCDSDRGMLIPDYFDSTFQADARAFVQAVAQHYVSSPYRSRIVYVRVATGTGGEQNLIGGCHDAACQSDYTADVDQLIAYGYTPTALITYDKAMLSFYKSAFNYTTVMYAFSDPIPQKESLDVNPATGNPVWLDVAEWAAANGMAVGQMGLSPNPSYASGGKLGTFFAYIQTHHPDTYVAFQTVSRVSGVFAVQGDITNATSLGARTIEWYGQDINIASYQSLFQPWQQAVDSRFGKSGIPTP